MFSLVFPKDIFPQTTERKQKTFTAVIASSKLHLSTTTKLDASLPSW
jgi:hypothetical protein